MEANRFRFQLCITQKAPELHVREGDAVVGFKMFTDDKLDRPQKLP